ncbi:hypothetical protein BS50DRAFT_567459 [Corynespora cassiicola Philippines]|uniref:Uncharacterized protein n=1 Tax=Corynespora cassiicola Philippines TaxID=1448308 RepID=A0A2T2PAH3_CORCC|nr:hypothetical protein BS50DRAFT_567459 [Corynespora cassiicola Philippines]
MAKNKTFASDANKCPQPRSGVLKPRPLKILAGATALYDYPRGFRRNLFQFTISNCSNTKHADECFYSLDKRFGDYFDLLPEARQSRELMSPLNITKIRVLRKRKVISGEGWVNTDLKKKQRKVAVARMPLKYGGVGNGKWMVGGGLKVPHPLWNAESIEMQGDTIEELGEKETIVEIKERDRMFWGGYQKLKETL